MTATELQGPNVHRFNFLYQLYFYVYYAGEQVAELSLRKKQIQQFIDGGCPLRLIGDCLDQLSRDGIFQYSKSITDADGDENVGVFVSGITMDYVSKHENNYTYTATSGAKPQEHLREGRHNKAL
jgi:hypothetical protein